MRKHTDESDILEESLLDDLEAEEVEDDDREPEQEEPDESSFDTAAIIDSNTVHPIDYLHKCTGVLKCRCSKPEELPSVYTSVIRFRKDDLTLSAFCDFIAVVFYMADANAVKIAIEPFGGKTNSYDDRYKFRIEKEQHCISIKNYRNLVELFGIFRNSPEDEQEILFVLLRTLNARFRKIGKLGKLGGERNFIAKWNRKKKPVFMVGESGEIYEIGAGCNVVRTSDGYACLKNSDGKYAIANPEGKLLGNRWFYNYDPRMFGEYGLAAVQTTALRWNFMDKDGNMNLDGNGIAAFRLGVFRNGYAQVFTEPETSNYMDIDGNYLMKEWNNYSGDVSDGRVVVKQGDYYTGSGIMYNYAKVPRGTLMFKSWLKKADEFADGFAVIANKYWEHNAIRPDGSYLFGKSYQNIKYSEYGLFRVKVDGDLYNVADKNGKFLLDNGYLGLDIISERLLQLRNAKNKVRRSMFVFDLQTKRKYKGEIVKSYDECGLYCIMQHDGSWNMMDADGNMLFNGKNVENGFSEPEFSEGFFWTSNGTDCIHFDIHGNIISSI